MSTLIAVGPLTAGGNNDIFKNADQIDAIVDYMTTLVSGQQQAFEDLSNELRAEFMTEIERAKRDIIAENASIVDAAVERLDVRFDSSFNAFVRQANEHMDSSFADIRDILDETSGRLESRMDVLEASTGEAVEGITARVDSSYVELVTLISEIAQSGDASAREYTDGKCRELDEKFTGKVDGLQAQVTSASTMLSARIDSVRLALDNEIQDRHDDFDREFANLNASLVYYVDDAKRDVSAYAKFLDLNQKDYIDDGIYSLREEKNADIAALGISLREYTDASVIGLKNVLENEISASDASLKSYLDASLAALAAHSEEKDAVLEARMNEMDTATTTALSYTNERITNLDASLNDRIEKTDASLRTEITSGDAGVLVAARTMSNDVSVKAKIDNDALRESLTRDIEDVSADVRSEFNASLNAAVSRLESYTDASVERVSEDLSTRISTVTERIESHIDSSVAQIYTTIETVISETDA